MARAEFAVPKESGVILGLSYDEAVALRRELGPLPSDEGCVDSIFDALVELLDA